MPNADRHDVGETSPERIDREEAKEGEVVELATETRRKARIDLILVGALLVGVSAFGWWQTGKFTDDLREAAVDACQRQNEVRAGINSLNESVRDSLGSSITVRRALGPDASPAQQTALRESLSRDRANFAEITDLTPTDCEAEYPDR